MLLCFLLYTLVFDALRLSRDAIRGAFFHFWQTGLLAIHYLFESFTQVLEEVKSISNLLSLGGAFPGSRRILSPAISAHDVYFRVRP
jgi:hypothetical protein